MYESPIRLLVQQSETSVREQQDKQIFEAIQKYGVDVDRDELIKALAYDRDQYDKGYADGRADAQRWISVEERLPEGEGWVLAIGLLLKRRSKGNYGWCVPHVAEYRHGRWCDSDGMIPDLEDRSLKITHWMSLPEPPEEESTC